MGHRILVGDVRARLRQLEADSIHCVATSPPYWGLRDYKAVGQIGLEASPLAWVTVMVEVFREIRRVLRPDGVVWLNLGDKYAGSGCGGSNASGTSTLEGSFENQNQSKLKRPRRPDECAATQRLATTANVGRRATRGSGTMDKQRLMLPARLVLELQKPYYTGNIKSEVDRAWLAALVDGEGCITITKTRTVRSVNFSYPPLISIHMTDRAPIDRAAFLMGGAVSEFTPKKGRKCYRTVISGPRAALVARELYPHLLIKQPQAMVAVHQQAIRDEYEPGRGVRIPPANLLLQVEGHDLIRALNQRAAVSIPSRIREPAPCFEPGWVVRDEIIWAKTNPMPSSVTDRTTPAHEMVYLLTKRPRYYFDALAIAESAAFDGPNSPDSITSPHGQGFTRRAHMRRAKVPEGWDNEDGHHGAEKRRAPGVGPKGAPAGSGTRYNESFSAAVTDLVNTRNKRSVWTIATEPFAEAHFATFPTSLVEPCILAGTSHRGVCPDCGAQWRRIERVTYSNPGNRTGNGPRSISRIHIEGGSAGFDLRLEKETMTLGWYPSCRCAGLEDLPKLARVPRRKNEAPGRYRHRKERALQKWEKLAQPLIERARRVAAVPAVVLDPFAGAGTTLLVADRLARDSIGIEINPDFADMAARRMAKEASLFAPKVEHAGR